MRDDLPKKAWSKECGIVNLDNTLGPGTHWVAYVKCGAHVKYFDSFGNLRPPTEVMSYLGTSARIAYNYERFQTFDQSICGQLCVKFLHENPL